MAANVTTTTTPFLSFATIGCTISKRFVSFSALLPPPPPQPYPNSFSRRTSKPPRRVVSSIHFAAAAAVNGQTEIVEEEEPRKLGNATQVYVCNLPRTCDTQHLLPMFTPHGTVLSAEICRNVETGESKGSAYVKMGSYNAAKNAVAALDGLDVEGREMRVKLSVQMNARKNNLETLNSSPVRIIYYEAPHKVYVGNLAKSATPEDVRHLFSRFGNVASVRILQDLKHGKSRVYAFVSYLSQSERDASISLSGTEFCGRTLVVREGVEKA